MEHETRGADIREFDQDDSEKLRPARGILFAFILGSLFWIAAWMIWRFC